MGASQSSLTPEDISELQDPSISQFSDAEIKALYERFKRLDRDASGLISFNEFHLIPELSMNPVGMRVIELFDEREERALDFKNFVKNFVSALWTMDRRAEASLKQAFAFKLYDVDEDGFVSVEDVASILRLMCGESMDEGEILRIATATVKRHDLDKDGRLSRQEFAEALPTEECARLLSMRPLKENLNSHLQPVS